jgi:hypothetical protein
MSSYKQDQARFLRKERKVIEAILHTDPPIINGFKILHTHHTNGNITFTAWKEHQAHEDMRGFVVHRQNVLTDEKFYETWHEQLRQLTLGKAEYEELRQKEWQAFLDGQEEQVGS